MPSSVFRPKAPPGARLLLSHTLSGSEPFVAGDFCRFKFEKSDPFRLVQKLGKASEISLMMGVRMCMEYEMNMGYEIYCTPKRGEEWPGHHP